MAFNEPDQIKPTDLLRAYLASLVRVLEDNYTYLYSNDKNAETIHERGKLRITINRDGSVLNYEKVQASSSGIADRIAVESVENISISHQFKPFPSWLDKPYITILVSYSVSIVLVDPPVNPPRFYAEWGYLDALPEVLSAIAAEKPLSASTKEIEQHPQQLKSNSNALKLSMSEESKLTREEYTRMLFKNIQAAEEQERQKIIEEEQTSKRLANRLANDERMKRSEELDKGITKLFTDVTSLVLEIKPSLNQDDTSISNLVDSLRNAGLVILSKTEAEPNSRFLSLDFRKTSVKGEFQLYLTLKSPEMRYEYCRPVGKPKTKEEWYQLADKAIGEFIMIAKQTQKSGHCPLWNRDEGIPAELPPF